MRSWKRLTIAVLACLVGMSSALAEGRLCVSVEECAALLAADGREIIVPGEWDDVFRLTEDRFALGCRSKSGMRYVLVDAEGNQLSEAAYEMLSMSGEVVLFRQNGLYGAMDRSGRILVEAEYTQLTAAGDGFLAMTDDPFDEDADEIFRITPTGEVLGIGVSSDEGLSAIRDNRMPYQNPHNERYGYIDLQGETVIEAQFETADRFENGIARASLDGLLGIIDADGEWKIKPEFDYLEIGDGVIVGLFNRERMVAFNMHCQEVFRIEGTQIEAAVAGRYPLVLEGDVLRVYSPEGDELFETDPQSTVTAGLDGQLILSDGDWGASCASLVSPEGVRAERKDQHLIPLSDGRYAFIKMNVAAYYSEALEEVRYSCDYDSLRWGMIDSAGKEILPAVYTEIRALGENRFLTIAEDGLRIVDGDGNEIWSRLEEE